MQEISEMIDALLAREGGYVNDPSDPGGATKYGITIHTLSAVRGRKCTPTDVRNLTKAEAREIYKSLYFQKPRIDELPHDLQPCVFDMQVNAGNRAVKILQETLNKFGTSLKVDGVIGSKTIDNAHAVFEEAGQYLVDAYGIERREYYYRLADRRAASRKYARTRSGGKGGWINRAEEFMSSKYRFSMDQHKARIAAWR